MSLYFGDVNGIGCSQDTVVPEALAGAPPARATRSARKLDKIESGLHAIETGELRIKCSYCPPLFYWPGKILIFGEISEKKLEF